jgi:hypothetical protein
LTIYLYHWIPRAWVLPWGFALSPPARIAFVSAASLAGAALLAFAAQRLLAARWSRVLIGA